MLWRSFNHQGVVYSLEHLHPFGFNIILAAKGNNPERSYRLNVEFSLHCFTRGAAKGEANPVDLAYKDSRETRIFDFERYHLSFGLPGIIQSLAEKKCFHDAHGKFYTIEILGENGEKRYYSIFFSLSKAGRNSGLNLFISSAHVRDERPYAKKTKPISFRVIVHNTWIKKALNPA